MFDRRAILTVLLATTVLSSSSSFSDAFQQPISVGIRNNGVTVTTSTSTTTLQMSTQNAVKKIPGTAKLDTPWEELGFEFRPTNSHVKLTYKDGEGWSKPELVVVSISYKLS